MQPLEEFDNISAQTTTANTADDVETTTPTDIDNDNTLTQIIDSNAADNPVKDVDENTADEKAHSATRKAVTKDLVMTAMFCALCIVLPMAFHAIPQGGMLFSPMHIPVLLAGMICGWQYGLAVGLVGPTLSAMITGMPPLATLPSMLVECAVYGAASGLLMKYVRTGHTYADMYISLVAAMIVGRIFGGASKALFFSQGEYAFATWISAYFVKCLPGIALHLVLIPNVVFGLMKARVIDARYPTKTTKNK